MSKFVIQTVEYGAFLFEVLQMPCEFFLLSLGLQSHYAQFSN